MNTKHEVNNCDKCSARLKTSMQIFKYMDKCQDRGKKDKFYCDVCDFSCKTMKTLNHMNENPFLTKKMLSPPKAHDPKKCDICGDKYESEEDMKDNFTKRHTNSIDPFIVKCAY